MKNFRLGLAAIPSYNLVNLSNSFLRHFGAPCFHEGIPEIEELLKGRKKVCVYLFDGMGEYVLNRHKEAGEIFLKNKKLVISSTNPATTVAATTAFLTGKYPIETGWLGWALPLLGVENPIEAFTSLSFLDGKPMGKDIMGSRFPTTQIDALLREVGVKAKLMFQYGIGGNADGPKEYMDSVGLASDFFADGGEFLYVYFNTPDGPIHHNGVDAEVVEARVKEAAKTVEAFIQDNPDVLTFVIADHALIDVDYVDLADYPEILDCLRGPISLEFRTASFFLKEGKEEEFKRLMKEILPSFALFKKEELLEKKYFGEGEIPAEVPSLLGDYIGIAQDETTLFDSAHIFTQVKMKAHHAGGVQEEKNIIVSVFNS